MCLRIRILLFLFSFGILLEQVVGVHCAGCSENSLCYGREQQRKKLRPVVVGVNSDMVAIASEVCGLNAIMPDRDISNDIYPNEREMVVIDNDLAVQRWNQ